MNQEMATFKYEDGALNIASMGYEMRIRWEGIPEASERRNSGRWRECSPEIRLLKPGATVRTGQESDPPADTSEKESAFAAFRAGVPAEIAGLVEPFASHQWNLLLFLRYSKESRDLAVSNGVLAYALANNCEICGTGWRLTLGRAMRHVKKKQRDICEALGFPGSEASVRLLRKISPGTCSPPILRILKLTLKKDPAIMGRLGYLRQIPASVIHMLSRGDISRLVTPALLFQCSEAREEAEVDQVVDMLFNIVFHATQWRGAPEIPQFASIRAVREFHDQMMLAMEAEQARIEQVRQQLRELERERQRLRLRMAAEREERNTRVFPPPPLPGTEHIVPITTRPELRMEGRQQHHCVGTYAHMILSGRYYVYKILQPERATVCIARDAGGAWRVNQLKGICNRQVSGDTCLAVRQWLNQYNLAL